MTASHANTKKENMHPADINCALIKAGLNHKKIANRFGISSSTVRHIITGRAKSWRVAHYIAEQSGYSIDEIWPDQYHYEPRETFKERCERCSA